jgi:hypothetical protein
VPTTLPRRYITETPRIHDALQIARARWGNKPTTELLAMLIFEGAERVAIDPAVQRQRRSAALESLAKEHPWPADADHLEKVREGWAE